MPLKVWLTQNSTTLAAGGAPRPPPHPSASVNTPHPGSRRGPGSAVLAGRVVAAVDRLLEVLLRVVLPELPHRGVGVDDGVLVEVPDLVDAPDVDFLVGVPVLVDLARPPRGALVLGGPQRLEELVLVLHVAADLPDRLGDPHGGAVVDRGREPHVVLLGHLFDPLDEPLVLGRVQHLTPRKEAEHAERAIAES